MCVLGQGSLVLECAHDVRDTCSCFQCYPIVCKVSISILCPSNQPLPHYINLSFLLFSTHFLSPCTPSISTPSAPPSLCPSLPLPLASLCPSLPLPLASLCPSLPLPLPPPAPSLPLPLPPSAPPSLCLSVSQIRA